MAGLEASLPRRFDENGLCHGMASLPSGSQ
jgi:hypothetical protein